jgi:hypothetical protein
MERFDMSTKELVRTYSYNDIFTNRADERTSVIKGRTVIELGTRTAASFVGNLYRVFEPSVKSYKYMLLVGVARQSPNWDMPIDEAQAEEVAALNAFTEPIMTLVVDEPFEDDYFIDLCIVLTEIMPTKFILTDEEKGITRIDIPTDSTNF